MWSNVQWLCSNNYSWFSKNTVHFCIGGYGEQGPAGDQGESISQSDSWRYKVGWILFFNWNISGLTIKHIMSVNDAFRAASELCHNLENHSRVINYNPKGIMSTDLWWLYYRHHLCQSSIDNHNMFIVRITGAVGIRTLIPRIMSWVSNHCVIGVQRKESNINLLTKDIKMPNSEALVFRSMIYENEGGGSQKSRRKFWNC